MENTKRTVTCGELTKADVGKKVVLNGWVSRTRDLGGLVFIRLRDRYGITQVMVGDKASDKVKEIAEMKMMAFQPESFQISEMMYIIRKYLPLPIRYRPSLVTPRAMRILLTMPVEGEQMAIIMPTMTMVEMKCGA